MKAKEFYELQTHDSTCVVGRMDKEEIINLMDAFCDAEVERRIKERMPSDEDAQNAEARYEDEQNEDKLRFDTEYCFRDYMNGWEDCRSRLTTPGDSQKTEGGGE